MKVVLCFAVLVTIFALASAEGCRDDNDCHHVTCSENDYRLDCHFGQCTCTHLTGGSPTTCNAPSDCTASDCRFGWHCVDGGCRCGFGFGPGGK